MSGITGVGLERLQPAGWTSWIRPQIEIGNLPNIVDEIIDDGQVNPGDELRAIVHRSGEILSRITIRAVG